MGTETTGKLHLIMETKQVSERFTKREFVLEIVDNPKYPQRVLFQITGDRVSQLDNMNVGDAVRVEYSLRGREWTSPQGEVKYFNSLDVWKIEPASANAGYDRGGGGRGGYRNDGGGNGGRGGNGGGGNYNRRDDDAPPPAYDPRPADFGGGGGGNRNDNDDLPF